MHVSTRKIVSVLTQRVENRAFYRSILNSDLQSRSRDPVFARTRSRNIFRDRCRKREKGKLGPTRGASAD